MTEGQTVVLERRMTWGGLLTIATILVTAGINWGVSQSQAQQTKDEVAAVKVAVSRDIDTIRSDVQDLQDARFADNSRMVRVETLLNEILQEVKAQR